MRPGEMWNFSCISIEWESTMIGEKLKGKPSTKLELFVYEEIKMNLIKIFFVNFYEYGIKQFCGLTF